MVCNGKKTLLFIIKSQFYHSGIYLLICWVISRRVGPPKASQTLRSLVCKWVQKGNYVKVSRAGASFFASFGKLFDFSGAL